MLKKLLMILGAILLLLALFVGGVVLYSVSYTVPEQAASIENTTGLVQAHRRALYDAQGTKLQLKGINAGQILLQEGWMSPFALEPSKNPDGSYITDADGNLQYPEFTEEEFRAGLQSNPNLAGYDPEELMQYYYSCFFTEEDFRIIREDLGCNTVRLPFYYLNILNADLSLKEEAEAFAYLDWFISNAAAQDLYVILDLHGAPGSQNGYEHSGAADRTAKLWESQDYRAATIRLWEAIARHYTFTRPIWAHRSPPTI